MMGLFRHHSRQRPDGRYIDPAVGKLAGEGALQAVREVEPASKNGRLIEQPPADTDSAFGYYGVPALKDPVWKWYIPTYFYVGGLAGASGVLGAAADLLGREELKPLVRRCRLVAVGGALASSALLIADLGRPERFLYMLRVVRPSSPMNMGTWILTAFGTSSGLAALPSLIPVGARTERACDAAALLAGLIGLPLTGYTGVLMANTAVPLWQGARHSLPILFSASGAASAASLLEMFPAGRAYPVTHRFALASKAAELGMTFVLEREAAAVRRVASPLRSGFSGGLWRAGQGLSLAGLVLTAFGGRRGARLAGVLGTAGALALRFALLFGGRRSARDSRATFEQQRARARLNGETSPRVSPSVPAPPAP